MPIYYKIYISILILYFNLILIKNEKLSHKPTDTYFFDLYNIYVLDHSAKDLWGCDDKVTIYIEKEIYVTSATCSKSSNIITLTCNSHKNAYQFVSLPSTQSKIFKMKISVGNESFSGSFNVNMTNLMSPQIVLINATNVKNNTTQLNETATIERSSFNAYVVFMIAPTGLISSEKVDIQLSSINILIPIMIIIAIISTAIIIWLTLWKIGKKRNSKNQSKNEQSKKNVAWIDINEIPNTICDDMTSFKHEPSMKQIRPQSSILDNRSKFNEQQFVTFKTESLNSIYPL
uniref:Uncharacterized protein n=1 Tax=Parastrongyloides trichosuri TaxID=131310 RepID=A0A0N4ZGZ9_PARTI